MPIADYIKLKPNPELELVLELKYGKPQPTEEYVNSLPSGILINLRDFLAETHPYAQRWSDAELRQVLIDRIRFQPERTNPLILKALTIYHSLLGRV